MGLDVLLLVISLLAIILIGLFIQIRHTYKIKDISKPHTCERCIKRQDSLSLRVSKAPSEDDGLGFARLGKCSQNALGVQAGDVVLIGKNIIVSALVADMLSGYEDEDIILLDRELVKMAEVSYGDMVFVQSHTTG